MYCGPQRLRAQSCLTRYDRRLDDHCCSQRGRLGLTKGKQEYMSLELEALLTSQKALARRPLIEGFKVTPRGILC